jgi:hypothetical protein
VANPGEGAASGHQGDWYSGTCSEGVGEHCDSELSEEGEGVRGMVGVERERDRMD